MKIKHEVILDIEDVFCDYYYVGDKDRTQCPFLAKTLNRTLYPNRYEGHCNKFNVLLKNTDWIQDTHEFKRCPACIKEFGNCKAGARNKEYYWAKLIPNIRILSVKYRVPGWDGYGAVPIEDKTCDMAMRFVRTLPKELEIPKLGVEPDGCVEFEWYISALKIFSISIHPDGYLYYAGVYGKRDTIEEGKFLISEVDMPKLVTLIKRVYS